MKADFHLHSTFSMDSQNEPEALIQTAAAQGLSIICFTDHMAREYPYPETPFDLDPAVYFKLLVLHVLGAEICDTYSSHDAHFLLCGIGHRQAE